MKGTLARKKQTVDILERFKTSKARQARINKLVHHFTEVSAKRRQTEEEEDAKEEVGQQLGAVSQMTVRNAKRMSYMRQFQREFKISRFQVEAFQLFGKCLTNKKSMQSKILLNYVEQKLEGLLSEFSVQTKLSLISRIKKKELAKGTLYDPYQLQVLAIIDQGEFVEIARERESKFAGKFMRGFQPYQYRCETDCRVLQLPQPQLAMKWQTHKLSKKGQFMEFLKERCPVLKKLSESKIDLIFREARIEYFREGERVFLQGFPCEYFGLVFSGMVLKRMEVSLEKGNRIPTAAGSVTDRLHLCLTSVFQIEFKYLTGEFFAFFDIIKGYTEFSEDLVVGAPSLLLLVKADCFKLFDKKEKECFLEASRKKIPDSHEALHEQFSRELQFSQRLTEVKTKAIRNHLQKFNSNELESKSARLVPLIRRWRQKLQEDRRKYLVVSYRSQSTNPVSFK